VREDESVLDGIVPKEFGKVDNAGGMLANLLEKNERPQQQLVNGLGGQVSIL
jgi:hypothetical protein